MHSQATGRACARRFFDRRQMLTVSLAAGFAAAVRPVVAATAITTDSKGLIAGEVRIPVSDGEIPAYRAMPDKGGPFPVILVVQEIFGVHEYIRECAAALLMKATWPSPPSSMRARATSPT